jgi:hypothetical protein
MTQEQSQKVYEQVEKVLALLSEEAKLAESLPAFDEHAVIEQKVEHFFEHVAECNVNQEWGAAPMTPLSPEQEAYQAVQTRRMDAEMELIALLREVGGVS